MFPSSYTGLRVIHEEKLREEMEQAHIDAELARSPRRLALLPLLRNALTRLRSRLNISARLEQIRYRSYVIVTKDRRDKIMNSDG